MTAKRTVSYRLPPDLVDALSIHLGDPLRGRIAYGAASTLIEHLLREWLSKQPPLPQIDMHDLFTAMPPAQYKATCPVCSTTYTQSPPDGEVPPPAYCPSCVAQSRAAVGRLVFTLHLNSEEE